MMTMAPTTLHSYDESFTDSLIAIFYAAVRCGAASDYSEDQIRAWAPDAIDQGTWHLKRSAHPTWVAMHDMKPAGFIDLTSDGRIDMLYVHPNFQRRGVATTLVKKVFEDAAQRSITSLSTEASITARPFFEVMGFSVIRPQSIFYNSQSFRNFQMQKTL